MKCVKCRADVPTAPYCCQCGAKQEISPRKPKTRGNGQGSVYRLPNGKWKAVRTVYYNGSDGKTHRRVASCSTFSSKREAVNALPGLQIKKKNAAQKSVTFSRLYEMWLPTHKASKATLDCYRAAYRYYEPLYTQEFADITIDDLQACLDECPKGKRTMQNMRTLAGLLYKYAIPRNIVSLNLGQYISVHAEDSGLGKDGLPLEALDVLSANVGIVPGADYVLCQCYLGFRPSEFIALDAINYNRKERAFTGGAKTDAGKNRVVTVSPKIQGIVDRLTKDKLSGPVFCAPSGEAYTLGAYRDLFYSVLESCGIENPVTKTSEGERRKYTPHSCRHTFATLMKRVAGASKDKLELIGHTSEDMLRHYQDVSFADLRKITDCI